MMKKILAGTIALTIAGAGLALAQQTQPPQTQSRDVRGPRLSTEDMAAFTDARVAALKAGLKLTPEQEKNWPAVEAAIRDLAKQRADSAAARLAAQTGDNARPRPDAIERLRRGADAMTTRAAALKHLADAAEPLYKSLDESQKHRFGMLLRMGGRGGHANWQRRG